VSGYLSGFDEVGKPFEIGGAFLAECEGHPLAPEHREDQGAQLSVHSAG
jgi:hypothetical protein